MGSTSLRSAETMHSPVNEVRRHLQFTLTLKNCMFCPEDHEAADCPHSSSYVLVQEAYSVKVKRSDFFFFLISRRISKAMGG